MGGSILYTVKLSIYSSIDGGILKLKILTDRIDRKGYALNDHDYKTVIREYPSVLINRNPKIYLIGSQKLITSITSEFSD